MAMSNNIENAQNHDLEIGKTNKQTNKRKTHKNPCTFSQREMYCRITYTLSVEVFLFGFSASIFNSVKIFHYIKYFKILVLLI